ncbi:MAG: hypothetical protein M1827_005792 [Pycnora praestabilis]|nr:MAG: hypothetical protein M1827_005792 [Pycnora praestabilis]
MSRSAADATRFTATGPHAHSKSSIPGSSPSSPQNRETPQEKVIRLRNAARQARLEKVSTFDKIVVRGRVIADKAHRFTALSLIAATGLVTFFALGDMIVYNRRRRREYYNEARAQHATALIAAREANEKGIADEDQMLLLNRERAGTEAEQARSQKKGIFRRTKDWFFSGLKNDEEPQQQVGGTLAAVGDAVGQEVWKEGATGSTIETGDRLGILKMVDDKKAEGRGSDIGTMGKAASQEPKASQALGASKGGPLDRLAEGEQPSSSSGGWTSFLGRR